MIVPPEESRLTPLAGSAALYEFKAGISCFADALHRAAAAPSNPSAQGWNAESWERATARYCWDKCGGGQHPPQAAGSQREAAAGPGARSTDFSTGRLAVISKCALYVAAPFLGSRTPTTNLEHVCNLRQHIFPSDCNSMFDMQGSHYRSLQLCPNPCYNVIVTLYSLLLEAQKYLFL